MRAAHLANLFYYFFFGGIHYYIRAETLCEFELVVGDVDGDHLSAEALCDLKREMAKPADAKQREALARLDAR